MVDDFHGQRAFVRFDVAEVSDVADVVARPAVTALGNDNWSVDHILVFSGFMGGFTASCV